MRALVAPPTLANAPSQPRPTAFTSRYTTSPGIFLHPGMTFLPPPSRETPNHPSRQLFLQDILPRTSFPQHPSGRREVRRRDASAHLPGPSSKEPLPSPKGFPLGCSRPTLPLSHPHLGALPGCSVLEDRTHPHRLSSPHSPRPGSCQNRHSGRALRTASPRSLAVQSHITSQCMHSKQAAGGAR